MKYKRGGGVILKPFLEERLRHVVLPRTCLTQAHVIPGDGGGQVNMLIKLQPDMLPLFR